MTVISLELAQRLGVKASEMIRTSMNITMANGNSMDIVGGIPIKMIHSLNGKVMESKLLVYVATGANQFFVCRVALCNLSLIPKVWPPEELSKVTQSTKGIPLNDVNAEIC